MTSLKEIEKLYYKAIEDPKLDKPERGVPGPPSYSTENFSRWARKVDILALEEGAANFASEQHQEIVKEFGEYRRTLVERLSKLFTYDGVTLPGKLKDIGSCWDGSKVGAVNEMDSLYVIQDDKLIIREHTDRKGIYHVYLKNDSTLIEIKPRCIRDQFADKYNQLVSELKPANCLEHGGYTAKRKRQGTDQESKSTYGGIRYNGPAATSQFLAKDETLLTWDITPAVVVSMGPEDQEVLQAIIADNPDKMFPPTDVHLIPDVSQNVWIRSTAQMEADILRVLSKEGPMKKALSFCKVLSSRLKAWNDKVKTGDGGYSVVEDVVTELLEIMEVGAAQTTQDNEHFHRVMRFAHIWIPSEKKEEYNEDTKSNISINNAAMKHILFKAASKKRETFGSKENMDLLRELIKEVFEMIGNEEVYSSEHAFLPGIRISHFSVSPTVAQKKQELARNVCQQFRTLVQESMTEVHVFNIIYQPPHVCIFLILCYT